MSFVHERPGTHFHFTPHPTGPSQSSPSRQSLCFVQPLPGGAGSAPGPSFAGADGPVVAVVGAGGEVPDAELSFVGGEPGPPGLGAPAPHAASTPAKSARRVARPSDRTARSTLCGGSFGVEFITRPQ